MIFPVERALLIINRTAGTGEGDAIADKLTLLFKQGLEGLSQVQVELVNNHAAARACAAGFLSESEAPALIVAGGGGGTLRAVIEGIATHALQQNYLGHGACALEHCEWARVTCLPNSLVLHVTL